MNTRRGLSRKWRSSRNSEGERWTGCPPRLTRWAATSISRSAKDRVPPGQRGPDPPQHRADPGEHLLGREGLGDIVVGAGVEAADAVGLLAAGGHHDDRDRPCLRHPAELAADLDARTCPRSSSRAGRGRAAFRDQQQRLLAVGGLPGLVAGPRRDGSRAARPAPGRPRPAGSGPWSSAGRPGRVGALLALGEMARRWPRNRPSRRCWSHGRRSARGFFATNRRWVAGVMCSGSPS